MRIKDKRRAAVYSDVGVGNQTGDEIYFVSVDALDETQNPGELSVKRDSAKLLFAQKEAQAYSVAYVPDGSWIISPSNMVYSAVSLFINGKVVDSNTVYFAGESDMRYIMGPVRAGDIAYLTMEP